MFLEGVTRRKNTWIDFPKLLFKSLFLESLAVTTYPFPLLLFCLPLPPHPFALSSNTGVPHSFQNRVNGSILVSVFLTVSASTYLRYVFTSCLFQSERREIFQLISVSICVCTHESYVSVIVHFTLPQ